MQLYAQSWNVRFQILIYFFSIECVLVVDNPAVSAAADVIVKILFS